MTIRILNPFDWSPVKSGDMLQLNGDHDRIVKIELNCEAPTRIDLVHHDEVGEERTTFLGIIQGLDKIEVVADAAANLVFSTEGEVWFCTNDGLVTAVEIPDESSFTKLVGRKSRSDQLEEIIRIQQRGMDRLIIAQEHERYERERLEAELAAAQSATVDSGTVVAPASGAQPEQAAPSEPAAQPGQTANPDAPANPVSA